MMSSGDSRAVSIHRRQPVRDAAASSGRSKSSASQYALIITCSHNGSCSGVERMVQAMLWESSAQSGLPSRTPCQSISARRSSSLRLSPRLSALPAAHHPAAIADQCPHEPVEVPVPIEEAPVEPAHIVVLAIGIVVATLGAAHFVAHLQHRGTD